MNKRLIAGLACLLFLMACDMNSTPNSNPSRSAAQSFRSSILRFGAVGDGTTLNTRSIQKAIDQTASDGGGTVVVPEGVFLSGAIFLKPGVELHLEKGAVIKGSTDPRDYPTRQTRIEGHFEPWLSALVNADGVDHLRISGEGTLDGSGKPFWEEFWRRIAADRATKNLDVPRPRLMFIQNCGDVRISGIHLKDSAFWNLHLYRCRDCVIDGLDFFVPLHSPSTDGVDVDSSQNVTIQNCHFSVDDDCVCLKGSKGPFALDDKQSPPVEHIRVRHCTFAKGESVLTVGSEATLVRDVMVEHCTVTRDANRKMTVVRLKLRPDTPQRYEDIHYNDITVNGNGQLVSIEPWTQYFDLKGQPRPERVVRNLTISNITGSCQKFGTVEGNPGDVIEDVLMENINLKLVNPTPKLVGVKDLMLNNVKINGSAYSGPDTHGRVPSTTISRN